MILFDAYFIPDWALIAAVGTPLLAAIAYFIPDLFFDILVELLTAIFEAFLD